MRCMTDNSRLSRQIQFYFIKFCFIKNVKMDTGHNILGCFKDNNCALLCSTFTVAVTNNLWMFSTLLHECWSWFNSKDLHSKYWQIMVKHIVYCLFVTRAHLESDVMNYTSASSINGNDPLDSVLCIESILGRSTKVIQYLFIVVAYFWNRKVLLFSDI